MSDNNTHEVSADPERTQSVSKSFYFGLFALAAGVIVLVGWLLDIPSLKSVFVILCMIMLMTGLIWWFTKELNRIDRSRRQSEAGLRESEERYRRLCEPVKDGLARKEAEESRKQTHRLLKQ